ncbi:MAG: hypothetical protein ACSHYA_00690 [Opitutaceae bacterium]
MIEKATIPSNQFTENTSAFCTGKLINLYEDAGCVDLQLDEVFGSANYDVRFAVESYGVVDTFYDKTTNRLRLFVGGYARFGQTTQIVIRVKNGNGESAVVTFKVTVWPSSGCELISA